MVTHDPDFNSVSRVCQQQLGFLVLVGKTVDQDRFARSSHHNHTSSETIRKIVHFTYASIFVIRMTIRYVWYGMYGMSLKGRNRQFSVVSFNALT